MPAGIRFSEAVYDRLGHDVVGEFVDALNRVDADYRAQLDKVNEANAARFEAHMDARFAEGHTRWMMGGWAIIFAALLANLLRRQPPARQP